MARYDLRLTEAQFWALTPYEFSLLLDRHRVDGRWQEGMAAVQPMLYAESLRDETRRRESFTLEEFTLTGMSEAARVAERDQAATSASLSPAEVWAKVGGVMRACGGN